jgi:HEPN domain-containing protein
MQNKSTDIKNRAESFYTLVKCLAQAAVDISLDEFLSKFDKNKLQGEILKELLSNVTRYGLSQKQFNLKIIAEIKEDKNITLSAQLNNLNNDILSNFCNNLFLKENKDSRNVKYNADDINKNKVIWIDYTVTTK